MTNIRPDPIAFTLADCVRQDLHPPAIAAALAVTLQNIDSTLSSVIGARGMAALYKRALFLATADHPWLSAAYPDADTSEGQALLQLVVSRQGMQQAAAGARAILHNFQSLLQILVGCPLTERLLQLPRTKSSQRASAQDHRS